MTIKITFNLPWRISIPWPKTRHGYGLDQVALQKGADRLENWLNANIGEDDWLPCKPFARQFRDGKPIDPSPLRLHLISTSSGNYEFKVRTEDQVALVKLTFENSSFFDFILE